MEVNSTILMYHQIKIREREKTTEILDERHSTDVIPNIHGYERLKIEL